MSQPWRSRRRRERAAVRWEIPACSAIPRVAAWWFRLLACMTGRPMAWRTAVSTPPVPEEPMLQDRPCDALAEVPQDGPRKTSAFSKAASSRRRHPPDSSDSAVARLALHHGPVEQGPFDAAPGPALAAHREDQGLELFGC
jgi:hypothetical protein